MDFFAKTGVVMSAIRLEVLRTLGASCVRQDRVLARQGELYRIMRMIENAPLNMMYCDLDLKIQYINPVFDEDAQAGSKYLPTSADEMLSGKSIDIFHRNPEH